MGSSKDRFIIFPSRANLNYITGRLTSTIRGHNLLKKKKDTLMLRQRSIIMEIRTQRSELPTIMRDAIYSFNRSKFLGVDFNTIGFYASPKSDLFVTISYNVIVGVSVPTFEVGKRDESAQSYPLAGLGKGGQQLVDTRNKFQEVTIKLIEMAAKMFANKSLFEAIKQTNKRVNALEYLLIPKLRATQHYIKQELDELEREEFFRLKKAKAQKVKNLLYAENVKTDEALHIKDILFAPIEPEEFVKIRKSLNQNDRQSIRMLLTKNYALEKI